MFDDLFGSPATANIMPDHRVEYVTAVGAGRSPFTHDLFDVVDVMTRSATIKAVTVNSVPLLPQRLCGVRPRR